MRTWQSEAGLRRHKGKPPQKRARFTLRLPPSIHERCVVYAGFQGIAVTEFIKEILTERIDRMDKATAMWGWKRKLPKLQRNSGR